VSTGAGESGLNQGYTSTFIHSETLIQVKVLVLPMSIGGVKLQLSLQLSKDMSIKCYTRYVGNICVDLLRTRIGILLRKPIDH
jgi:hypothetical protein